MPSPEALTQAKARINAALRLIDYAPGGEDEDQLLHTATHHLETALEILRPSAPAWRTEHADYRRSRV